MSEQNKAIVRRFYEELDKKNFGIFFELCTPSFVSHFPGSPCPQTLEAREQTSRMFYQAFPDIQHTLDEVIAEGNKVAFRGTARGIHNRVFQGILPTGKSISFTLMRFYHIDGGKITEEWANFDSLGLMQQLGAIPAPAQEDS
jgi:predicted ester cyclase